jgi:hypothetical protein
MEKRIIQRRFDYTASLVQRKYLECIRAIPHEVQPYLLRVLCLRQKVGPILATRPKIPKAYADITY